MQRVIEIYKRNKLPGVSTAHVYRTHIFPVYPISICTLYTYLSTPVERELKALKAADREIPVTASTRRAQLKLFD